MKKATFFGGLVKAAAVVALLIPAQRVNGQEEVDFTTGVFIINEDCYGQGNSTVNYLMPDASDENYWHYRVIQANNEDKQLGCTAQSGEIWNGKFYIISKQAKDPGASIEGGRITVVDATTMKVEYQIADISTEVANVDGRSFIGVTEGKGYVSTSKGVWVLDFATQSITECIEGTDEGAESGSMVMAADKVFVAHFGLGLLVIDPKEDKLVDAISCDAIKEQINVSDPSIEGATIGSVVLAKNGSLWCSIAGDANGTALPYLLKVNPETLETELVEIPSDFYAPANSWYAWTPDAFCASAQNNTLYWKGGASSWVCGYEVFKYDIDKNEFKRIINLTDDQLSIYGCSMRVHPVTDELYMSLNSGWTPPYYVRRYTSEGELIKEYPMIEHNWFPSLPVFAQGGRTSGIEESVVDMVDNVEILIQSDAIVILNGEGLLCEVYTLSGSLIGSSTVTADYFTMPNEYTHGVYIVKVGTHVQKVCL